jgi:pimeloyl-ACP methyl ester carboxylesterase
MTIKVPGWVPPTLGLVSRVAPKAVARVVGHRVLRPRQNLPQAWEIEPLRGDEPSARELTLANGLAALCWEPLAATRAPWVFAQHGWEGRPTQFRPLAGALVAQGYRVLAIEGPGHGRSPGKQASPWLFAQALLAAQAEFGAPDAVVGHSLGGGAVPIALAHGLRARRVATLGAPAAMSEITENFLKAVGVGGAARSELRRLMDEHGGRPMRELDPEVLAALAPVAQVRALIVHCVDDVIVAPDQGRRLAAAWPAATLRETRGLGHRNLLRDPATVAAVVAFFQAD